MVDNLSTGRRENLHPRASFYELDLRDQALSEVFERERPEVVNHHAAQASVLQSTADPVADADVNLLGSVNLLQRAVEHGVDRVVYISSGGAAYGEPEYLPVDESHRIAPLSGYGVSKSAVEQYLRVFRHVHGLDYVVLRYPNVYGPRQDPYGEGGVVAIFTDRMLRGASCTINGDGLQQRDFVFVGDCVKANELAHAGLGGSLDGGQNSGLDVGQGGGQSDVPIDGATDGAVYNLGTGELTSIRELFERLADIAGYSLPPVYGPPKPGETYRICLDATLARDELGWEPAVSLDEGLRLTVDHFRHRNGVE